MPAGSHRPRSCTRTRTLLALLALTLLVTVAVARAATTPSPGPAAAGASPAAAAAGGGDGDKIKISKAHPAQSYPALKSDRPIFFLVLGSDSRSKQPQAIAHGRADSIHIVGINPAKHRAGILGFPRDSWVNIPGHGQNKINDAMFFGGTQGAVAQIESMTGIKIDYVVLGGFYSFRDMVTAMGGIKVDVPYPMNDDHAKIHVKAGPEVMMGKEALGFNRARYGVPGGDFGRSENQGFFLISMLKQFRQQFSKDPSVLLRYLGAIQANIESDVSFEELVNLAFTVSEIDPKNVVNRVVPGSIGMAGSESIVKISSSANALYNDLKADGYLKG